VSTVPLDIGLIQEYYATLVIQELLHQMLVPFIVIGVVLARMQVPQRLQFAQTVERDITQVTF
jgi:hypothetical protein